MAGNLVDIAKGELGVPYVWGGASTSGFDCSGLMQWIYGQAGIKIPRTSREQKKAGISVPLSQAQPGDLLLYTYYGSASNPPPDNHIGMYVGPGQMIDAPRPGKSVEYDPIDMSALSGVVHIAGNVGRAGQAESAILGQQAAVATNASWAPGGDWDPLNWPGDLLSSAGGVFSQGWNDLVQGTEGALGNIASSLMNAFLTAVGPIILTSVTVIFAAALVGMGLWKLTERPREAASQAAESAAPIAALAA
ncbi:MAG: C40 family peptidase [Streptomyces sp.]|nr:C40 family peptidase [Streptomyces sp.]